MLEILLRIIEKLMVAVLPERFRWRFGDGHWDLPSALAKAATDSSFDYLVVLRDGTPIRCDGVIRSRPGWLSLMEPRKPDDSQLWGCCLERNLQVRISDIMACADAPHGS